MQNNFTHKNHALLFRQWSRNNYAVFASLGKEVNIGHIDIDICDKALEKDKKKREVGIKIKESYCCESDEFEESVSEIINNEKALLLSTLNTDESSRNSRKLLINHIILSSNIILFSGYRFVLYKNC